MLQIYGSPLSSPVNKVRYVANYLNIPYEYHNLDLSAGEQRTAEFLKINPLGKIPAINDNGFGLGESNAIIRYLAAKQPSDIYPQDLQQRALIDQWIEFASHHIALAIGKILYNTYFYKMAKVEKDTRSFEDGHKFIAQYLPLLEKQLTAHKYIMGDKFTLADIAILAALDSCELCSLDLTVFSHLNVWRTKLMQASFYTACHKSFTESFQQALDKA